MDSNLATNCKQEAHGVDSRDEVRPQHDSAGRPVNTQVESSSVGVVTAARWRLRRRGGSDSRLDINKAICLVCEKIPRALITINDSKSSWSQVRLCAKTATLYGLRNA